MDILLIIIITIFCNVFQKIADALDEHGLKLFRHADVLFGVIWGILWALLTNVNSNVATYSVALIFYWLIKGKIDYVNHAISIIIVFSSLFILKTYPSGLFIFILLGYLVLDKISHSVKFLSKNNLKVFLKLLSPLVFSLYVQDFLPILIAFLSVLTVHITKLVMYKYKVIDY